MSLPLRYVEGRAPVVVVVVAVALVVVAEAVVAGQIVVDFAEEDEFLGRHEAH